MTATKIRDDLERGNQQQQQQNINNTKNLNNLIKIMKEENKSISIRRSGDDDYGCDDDQDDFNFDNGSNKVCVFFSSSYLSLNSFLS